MMRLKNTDNDNAILRHITNNPEATMNYIASNSIGKAILDLKNRYFGPSPDEETVLLMCEKCIQEFKCLEVQNFLFFSMQFYNEIKLEIEKQLDRLKNKLIGHINEPVSALDTLSLYLPVDEQKNYDPASKKFDAVQIVMPLREVFTLFWLACHDDSGYMQHYTGTSEEQFQQARADLPKRLLSFFRCMQRIQSGICHQGIRNELILLLNHTFNEVKIIEDAAATIHFFLKERISRGIQDRALEKDLFKKVCQWIIHGDAAPVLQHIDPDYDFLSQLKKHFLQNACDPRRIGVTDTISGNWLTLEAFTRQSIQCLPFSMDLEKFPQMQAIQTLLTADEKIVYRMHEWIQTEYTIGNPVEDENLSHYYTHYTTFQQLIKYADVLCLTGHYARDASSSLIEKCHRYFDTFSETGTFPTVSLEDLNMLRTYTNAVAEFHANSHVHSIENFFLHWFGAHSIETKKQLYGFLLDESLQKKIFLLDEDIEVIYRNGIITEGDVIYNDITPYAINRLFLTAILTHPSTWTDLFALSLRAVFSFVKNLATQKGLGATVRHDSWPEELLIQIEYLLNVYSHLNNSEEKYDMSSEARPEHMILMPRDAKTLDEWFEISILLDEKAHAKYYQALMPKISQLFTGNLDILDDDFKLILFGLPENRRSDFLYTFTLKNAMNCLNKMNLDHTACYALLQEAKNMRCAFILNDELDDENESNSVLQKVINICYLGVTIEKIYQFDRTLLNEAHCAILSDHVSCDRSGCIYLLKSFRLITETNLPHFNAELIKSLLLRADCTFEVYLRVNRIIEINPKLLIPDNVLFTKNEKYDSMSLEYLKKLKQNRCAKFANQLWLEFFLNNNDDAYWIEKILDKLHRRKFFDDDFDHQSKIIQSLLKKYIRCIRNISFSINETHQSVCSFSMENFTLLCENSDYARQIDSAMDILGAVDHNFACQHGLRLMCENIRYADRIASAWSSIYFKRLSPTPAMFSLLCQKGRYAKEISDALLDLLRQRPNEIEDERIVEQCIYAAIHSHVKHISDDQLLTIWQSGCKRTPHVFSPSCAGSALKVFISAMRTQDVEKRYQLLSHYMNNADNRHDAFYVTLDKTFGRDAFIEKYENVLGHLTLNRF